jgi:hypothetical protein
MLRNLEFNSVDAIDTHAALQCTNRLIALLAYASFVAPQLKSIRLSSVLPEADLARVFCLLAHLEELEELVLGACNVWETELLPQTAVEAMAAQCHEAAPDEHSRPNDRLHHLAAPSNREKQQQDPHQDQHRHQRQLNHGRAPAAVRASCSASSSASLAPQCGRSRFCCWA